MTSVSLFVLNSCLAVQHHHDRAVLVEDRLVPGHQVDHAQALNAEARPLRHVHPPSVRAAVLQRRTHLDEEERLDRPALSVHLSDDSAHWTWAKPRRGQAPTRPQGRDP